MPSFINPGVKSYTRLNHVSHYVPDEISESSRFARVVDVILDSTHPKYKELGGSQALYGVFFQPLFGRNVEELDVDFNLRFAYCKQNALRQIPVRTEIVELEVAPASAGIQERKDEGFVHNVYQEKIYWTSIVPVWNHPHLNMYPDVRQFETDVKEVANLGDDFQENMAIKPLQLSPGDVVLEGRHGQSIRMGGTKSKVGSLSDDKSNGRPYTIIRNGQAETSGNVCVEDVNRDDSSIYLTSDHVVPLEEASRKFSGAKKQPELAKDYKGKQIVVTSDKVTVNARKHNVVLSAKEHLAENAKSVSIDGEDYVGVDADKIYLGTHAQKELNPVLKGQETIDLLNDAFNTISSFLQILGAAPSEPSSWVAVAHTEAKVAQTSLKAALARINSIKSKKVYTE